MGCLVNPRYEATTWGDAGGEGYPAIRDTHTGQLDLRACVCTSCVSTTERLLRQLNDGTIQRTHISFCWETR